MTASFKEILGNKIKQLRAINEVTQMDLAKALGMTSTGAVSQIEQGLKGMKVENILKAAEFFNVHPIVLISGNVYTNEDIKKFVELEKKIKAKQRG